MCVPGLQLYVLSPVPSKRSGPFRITSHSVALAVPEVRCNGECNCNSTSQLVSNSSLHCTECDQFSRWREAADMARKSVLGGHTEKLKQIALQDLLQLSIYSWHPPLDAEGKVLHRSASKSRKSKPNDSAAKGRSPGQQPQHFDAWKPERRERT